MRSARLRRSVAGPAPRVIAGGAGRQRERNCRVAGVNADTIRVVIEFPEVPPGEPLVVSATLYVTYTRCPDQALGRLRGLYPPESPASFKGGLAHRIFARHLRSGEITSFDFEQVCREEIGTGMNAKLGALGMRPSQLRATIKEVGHLYERFKVLSAEGFDAAEVLVEVQPDEDLMLRGSIDAIFGDPDGVRLIDWKTGSLFETEQQLGFYAMLWALDTGNLPARVEAVSIGSGERLTAVPTEDTINATAAAVADLVRKVRSAFATGADQMDRIAGPWCRYCALLASCSEGAAAVQIADAG